jgi:hypothetical protein
VSIDVSSIVPSTRDFLQAIATRRKRLALVPLVSGDGALEDVARLVELDVVAIAVPAASEDVRALSAAARNTPLVSLEPVRQANDALAARACGLDAVVVDPGCDFDALSRDARSTRMAALAMRAGTSAKGVYLRGERLDLDGLAGARVLAHLIGNCDAAALRALRGQVDAAIAAPHIHRAASFAELSAELES